MPEDEAKDGLKWPMMIAVVVVILLSLGIGLFVKDYLDNREVVEPEASDAPENVQQSMGIISVGLVIFIVCGIIYILVGAMRKST